MRWPYGLIIVLSFVFVFNIAVLAKDDERRVLNTWSDPITEMSFVWVEGGCYEMGCGQWQTDCREDEKPAHKVCLDGFWIGTHEVTQEQWQTVMGSNPSDYQAGKLHPVEMITWNDTQKFVQKLNLLNKDVSYRLPTEAEWEYAARGRGKKDKYSGGSTEKEGLWHHWEYIICGALYPGGVQTQQVGSSKPNSLGLYDMSGNVNEWVQDWYGKDYYASSVSNNPRGPENGSEKVARGGHHPRFVHSFRTTSRFFHAQPDWNDFATGFRLAVDKKENKTK